MLSVREQSAERALKWKSRAFIDFDRDIELDEILQSGSVFGPGGTGSSARCRKNREGVPGLAEEGW